MVIHKDLPNKIIIGGPYGAGKSTLAELIAESIICENYSLRRKICGHCPGCSNIFTTIRKINCFETSLNKQLQRSIKFHFMISGRRVLLLDEVHAWERHLNLLQAILDGMPERGFIIATTHRPEKLSPPFINRCYSINLSYLSDLEMKDFLLRTCRRFNLSFANAVLDEIIKKSGGNPREALVRLEGHIHTYKSTISLTKNVNKD